MFYVQPRIVLKSQFYVLKYRLPISELKCLRQAALSNAQNAATHLMFSTVVSRVTYLTYIKRNAFDVFLRTLGEIEIFVLHLVTLTVDRFFRYIANYKKYRFINPHSS